MAENEALLAVCLDRPDDLERLRVYADWLEEHGDARAAYVRAQLAIRGASGDQRSQALKTARFSYPRSSTQWLRSLEHAGAFEPHLLEVPCAWRAIGLGVRDTERTYGKFPFPGQPPLPVSRFDGRFRWLRAAPVVTEVAEDDPRDWEERLHVVSAEGYEVPESLAWLLPDADLHQRLPSCTDCYFLPQDRGELHRQDGGDAFLTFYSDSQACLTWGVRLGPRGDTYAPVLVGAPEDLPMDEAQDPDEPYSYFPELELCAQSVEEFIFRWWIENSIWYATQSRDRRRPKSRLISTPSCPCTLKIRNSHRVSKVPWGPAYRVANPLSHLYP